MCPGHEFVAQLVNKWLVICFTPTLCCQRHTKIPNRQGAYIQTFLNCSLVKGGAVLTAEKIDDFEALT